MFWAGDTLNFNVTDYRKSLDKTLIELSQRSIFYKRKEFEYIRDPNEWIYRYRINKDHVIKVALDGRKVIASLGVVQRRCIIDKKMVKVGCFVDNDILPEYLDHYEDVFSELFIEVEKEMDKEGMVAICGWDFLKKAKKHKNFFRDMGFNWVEGVNWYPGGSDLEGVYPKSANHRIKWYWKVGISLLKYQHRLKEFFIPKLSSDVNLRDMIKDDIPAICNLLNGDGDKEFESTYELREYESIIRENNMHGIVAEKNSKIIGVLTYITSAWSGWMFSKPYYSKKWSIFYSYTPDEFVVSKEYQDTSLPANMLLMLMKTKDPERKLVNDNNYNFMVDVFDRRIKWRRDALLKLGCTDPEFDYGVILAKSLRDDIELDTNKIWHLPARYIVAPVPSSAYFQKQGQ